MRTTHDRRRRKQTSKATTPLAKPGTPSLLNAPRATLRVLISPGLHTTLQPMHQLT